MPFRIDGVTINGTMQGDGVARISEVNREDAFAGRSTDAGTRFTWREPVHVLHSGCRIDIDSGKGFGGVDSVLVQWLWNATAGASALTVR